MAFSDEMIRAIVEAGQYSDPAARKLLADVLIERRNKIGKAYLTAINPVINVALAADGTLSFENAAVATGVAQAPAGGYTVTWSRFDNATGTPTEVGTSAATAAGRATPATALPSDERDLPEGRHPRRPATRGAAPILGSTNVRIFPADGWWLETGGSRENEVGP